MNSKLRQAVVLLVFCSVRCGYAGDDAARDSRCRHTIVRTIALGPALMGLGSSVYVATTLSPFRNAAYQAVLSPPLLLGNTELQNIKRVFNACTPAEKVACVANPLGLVGGALAMGYGTVSMIWNTVGYAWTRDQSYSRGIKRGAVTAACGVGACVVSAGGVLIAGYVGAETVGRHQITLEGILRVRQTLGI